jgi:hypothetical protein
MTSYYILINKTKFSFTLNVILHSSITQDVLPERDFTGSDAKAAKTNTFLYLTKDYHTLLAQTV